MTQRHRIPVELRATTAKSRTIKGHAAVFNQETRIGSYWERIEPGAFRDAIERDDVVALFNHDEDKILGRSSAETLRMRETDHGLEVEIDLPDTQLGNDVLELVRRGDLKGMSFGFVAGDEDWETRDGEQVRIHRSVAQLIDVSVVTHPAYPQTDVHVRKFNREVEIMPESLETAEAIAEAMDALIEGAEGRSLSEDEQAKYTELEKKLELIRKSEEIRSRHEAARKVERPVVARNEDVKPEDNEFRNYLVAPETRGQVIGTPAAGGYTDRKSTRLNFSHVKISYAVFCLKKKRLPSRN